jgi:hypothetical protein
MHVRPVTVFLGEINYVNYKERICAERCNCSSIIKLTVSIIKKKTRKKIQWDYIVTTSTLQHPIASLQSIHLSSLSTGELPIPRRNYCKYRIDHWVRETCECKLRLWYTCNNTIYMDTRAHLPIRRQIY